MKVADTFFTIDFVKIQDDKKLKVCMYDMSCRVVSRARPTSRSPVTIKLE